MTWTLWDGMKRNRSTWASQHQWWREQGMKVFSTAGYFMSWSVLFKPGHWDSTSCISERGDAKIISCFWTSKSRSRLLLKYRYDFRAEVMLFLLRAVGSSISEVFFHQKKSCLALELLTALLRLPCSHCHYRSASDSLACQPELMP